MKQNSKTTFLCREISWLDFNARVLSEAASPNVPLLERLKFIAIFNSNLDEFFMVRIARLLHQNNIKHTNYTTGEIAADELLTILRNKLDKLLKHQQQILNKELFASLTANDIRIEPLDKLSDNIRKNLKEYFCKEVMPILTPLTMDAERPIILLNNCSTNLILELVQLEDRNIRHIALLEIPSVLERFIQVPGKNSGQKFVLLEDLIASEINMLFPGCEILSKSIFRITRDMDLAIQDNGNDLRHSVEVNLRERRRRQVIRLEIPENMPQTLFEYLQQQLKVDDRCIFRIKGFFNCSALTSLIRQIRVIDWLDNPLPPLDHPELPSTQSIFESVTQYGEIMLAVPFHKFDPILQLLAEAADDPSVLAIKQTLYRVSSDPPVVELLARAAANGKQVTAVVELKARFDEGNNLIWAQRLEDSGAHVVYGISGLKIHAKALLIIRREGDEIKHYVHLATGNYNDKTACIYSDLSIFSDNQKLAEEVGTLFNIITGRTRPTEEFSIISAAPFHLRWKLLKLIDRETEHARAGHSGHIIIKVNSLSDDELIEHLYMAGAAGVKVELIVRGVCRLLPCANIRVVSIIDRFLEHSRIFYFANGTDGEYYLSSADFMTRNLDRRIELLFPVTRQENRRKLKKILAFALKDRCKAHVLEANGKYTQLHESGTARSQQNIYDMFAAESRNNAGKVFKIFSSGTNSGKS